MLLENVFLKSYGMLRTFMQNNPPLKNPQRKVALIGDRKSLYPNGKLGFIQIDTISQNDQDIQKGVHHIKAVNEVTQFDVACTVEKISELFLLSAINQLPDCFPFVIRGFHSDNGP